MKNRLQLAKSCLSAASLVAAAYALTGCGGTTYNNDANGVKTGAADPYIYAYQDNFETAIASGLGISSTTGNPAASDIFYFTFASANSAPGNTLAGAGPFVTGLGQGASGTFTPGTTIPGAPTNTAVEFRAQGVQGQTTSRQVPDITSVQLTGPAAAVIPFSFEFDASAPTSPAGPFLASPYVATVTTPATSGVYAYSAKITDALSETTTTTFQGVVLAPGYAAIASASMIALTQGTPTVTYGPDSDGDTVLIFPAGLARVSVAGGATQLVQTTAGQVTIL